MLPLVAGASFLVAVVLMLGPVAEGGTPKTNFVSKRYGYSVVLAGGSARYFTAHAITNWSGSEPRPSNRAFDQISDLKTRSLYMVAAKRIPPGWTLRKWTSFTISTAVPPCTYKQQTLTKSNLGGAPALVYDLKCWGGFALMVGAIHAHRGYFFIDFTRNVSDRRPFNAALRSFHFLGE